GPGIMISFVITGTLCVLVALSYAELASAIPVSGSAYSYSYASMGEIVAWVMGLLLVLEYGLAASTVAVGWSGYVMSLLHDIGVNLPPALRGAPGTEVADFTTGAVVGMGSVNLPAIIGIGARKQHCRRDQGHRGGGLHRDRRVLREARAVVAADSAPPASVSGRRN